MPHLPKTLSLQFCVSGPFKQLSNAKSQNYPKKLEIILEWDKVSREKHWKLKHYKN